MATYSRRLARKRKPLSAESMYLLVVVAAGLLTAWWAARQLPMNLSAIQTVAAVLGITESVGTTRPVGYSATQAQAEAQAQAAQDVQAPAALYCQGSQTPAFANGFAALKQQVGNAMGNPTECEHAASAAGNTVQQTTTGLAAYSSMTNTATFTDGWRHWAMTPNGLVTWEGTEAQPPLQLAPAPEDSTAAQADPDPTQ